MSWSFQIIRDKKRYFTLHMKIIIVKMINRMFFENFLKIFKIKKCERFIKNCILRQCFNCQKYEHIKKHCRIVVVCEKCVMKHHINKYDSSIIAKYKMCETCENREHIAWSSKCRMRRKKKQKTERARQIRMQLYLVSESQIVFSVFQFVINSSTTSFTISITNSKVVFSKWKMIKIKKKWAFEIKHFSRIFIDFATHRVKKQYDKLSRQKFVNEQCDYELEEHEKNIASKFDESIQICKQIVREYERVNRDKSNDRLRFFMKNTNVLIILQYNVRNEKYVRWFRCSLIKTFKIMMSSQYKNFDEISSHRFHWAIIKMIFIYYINRKMTSESVFTLMIK
jgi:hypothetical protein